MLQSQKAKTIIFYIILIIACLFFITIITSDLFKVRLNNLQSIDVIRMFGYLFNIVFVFGFFEFCRQIKIEYKK